MRKENTFIFYKVLHSFIYLILSFIFLFKNNWLQPILFTIAIHSFVFILFFLFFKRKINTLESVNKQILAIIVMENVISVVLIKWEFLNILYLNESITAMTIIQLGYILVYLLTIRFQKYLNKM